MPGILQDVQALAYFLIPSNMDFLQIHIDLCKFGDSALSAY